MVTAMDSHGMLTMVMEQTISTTTAMVIQQVLSCSVVSSPLTIHSVTRRQYEDMGPLDPPVTTETARFTTIRSISKKVSIPSGNRSHGNGGPVDMENNIFYFAGNSPGCSKWLNPSGNKTFSNNLYYNVSTYPNDANAVKVNAGTQVLVNAGSGPDSVAEVRVQEDMKIQPLQQYLTDTNLQKTLRQSTLVK